MTSFSHNDFEYIDMHTHFFPPQIFRAIWDYFEQRDSGGNLRGWLINYKLPIEELVDFLEQKNVKAFTTFNYAHKEEIAESINEWTYHFARQNSKAIPFGCVWPADKNRLEYVEQLFDQYEFRGIKIQPLVQNFFLHDERMSKIYELIIDRGKWLTVHIGTAPYKNRYVGYKHFLKFIKKYPDMNVQIAHMGAFEYRKFLNLLDRYENIYLDTAMTYIPENIFPERKSKRPNKEDLITYQDRILFGSDFPNIPYNYEESTKGLLELDLPIIFYENIFYKNAKRLFFS